MLVNTSDVNKARTAAENSATNLSNTRLDGIPKGGAPEPKKPAPVRKTVTIQPGFELESDWRVKITAPVAGPYKFSEFVTGQDKFKNGEQTEAAKREPNLLEPLSEYNGVVFPFTPQITVNHSANYSPLSPTHSNYPSYFYQNSQVGEITITAEFAAQTEAEAKYVLAAIYFFRAATKMFYNGIHAGNPPPILYLDGYGAHYFPHVPVVVTSFSHTMPADVDYITCQTTPDQVEKTDKKVSRPTTPAGPTGINLGGTGAPGEKPAQTVQSENQVVEEVTEIIKIIPGLRQRIPTLSSFTVTLMPVYSRRSISQSFDWESNASRATVSSKDNPWGKFL